MSVSVSVCVCECECVYASCLGMLSICVCAGFHTEGGALEFPHPPPPQANFPI